MPHNLNDSFKLKFPRSIFTKCSLYAILTSHAPAFMRQTKLTEVLELEIPPDLAIRFPEIATRLFNEAMGPIFIVHLK